MSQCITSPLPVCVQVSVFGYGADQQGNWHHYWEENRYAGAFRKTGVHSADFETEVIHKLDKEGKISLHLWHYHWPKDRPAERLKTPTDCWDDGLTDQSIIHHLTVETKNHLIWYPAESGLFSSSTV